MELVQNASLLALPANTKSAIEQLALVLIDEVEEKGNVLQLAETISATENLIKKIKENTRYSSYLQETLALSSGKVTTESGARIETMEGGTKYDYSQCNASDLYELEAQKAEVETKIKEIQAFLKTVPVSGLKRVDNQGEVVTLFPPSKTSVTTAKVTLAK